MISARTTKVIANAISINSTTERFLEIQVEVSKFKTFEIKIFRNLNLAYLENFYFENNQLYGISSQLEETRPLNFSCLLVCAKKLTNSYSLIGY